MDIRQQLQRAHIKPDKKSGQNFLLNEHILDLIVATAELNANSRVLEIGSGPGNLTVRLAESAGHVWAVERDQRLIPVLRTTISPFREKVQLVADDIFHWRKTHAADLSQAPYIIVANLPYYLTSRALREFLELAPKPERLVVLVQKEVAERMTAPVGKMSLLSLSVQLYSEATIAFEVGAEAFWPAPEVDSAVVQLTRIRPTKSEDASLFRVARMAFAGRRKQLHNTLAAGLRLSTGEVAKRLEAIGLDSSIRPQELSVADWKMIAAEFV